MLDRIKRATPATIANTWYSAGAIADPGTVTVGIVRADGSVVVPAGTATTGAGAAARTFPLTATHTALLDTLTATWTSSTLGTDTTEHEIVGDFLYSLDEFKAITLSGAKTIGSTFTTSQLTDMRTTVEQALEDACGVAFVPRYERETLNSGDTNVLLTRWPRITAIRSATIDAAAISTSTDVIGLREGILHFTRTLTRGYGNVVVGYEHGYTAPPARVIRAALLLARSWLVSGPIDDRASTFSSPDTGVTYSMVTPGVGGSVFGLPEVDAVVQQYSLRAGVA